MSISGTEHNALLDQIATLTARLEAQCKLREEREQENDRLTANMIQQRDLVENQRSEIASLHKSYNDGG